MGVAPAVPTFPGGPKRRGLVTRDQGPDAPSEARAKGGGSVGSERARLALEGDRLLDLVLKAGLRSLLRAVHRPSESREVAPPQGLGRGRDQDKALVHELIQPGLK